MTKPPKTLSWREVPRHCLDDPDPKAISGFIVIFEVMPGDTMIIQSTIDETAMFAKTFS